MLSTLTRTQEGAMGRSRMSALGQKRTHATQQRMSALGQKRTFGGRVAELVHRDLRAGHTIQESLEVEACELVLRLLSQMRGKGRGGARIACF